MERRTWRNTHEMTLTVGEKAHIEGYTKIHKRRDKNGGIYTESYTQSEERHKRKDSHGGTQTEEQIERHTRDDTHRGKTDIKGGMHSEKHTRKGTNGSIHKERRTWRDTNQMKNTDRKIYTQRTCTEGHTQSNTHGKIYTEGHTWNQSINIYLPNVLGVSIFTRCATAYALQVLPTTVQLCPLLFLQCQLFVSPTKWHLRLM